jgi:homoserine kinase
VLKPTVSLKEAIIQSGNIAGLMIGLMKPDYNLISRSLRDVIAEPIRSVFIPGFDEIRKRVVDAGGLGCGISGSGPTIFCLSGIESIAHQVGKIVACHFENHQLKSDVFVSTINYEGAKILA